MKKIVLTLMIFTCTVVNAQMTTTYELDTSQSVIHWKGSYSFSFSEHKGTVNLSSGKLYAVNDQITGGSFTIDMTTIDNEDYQNGYGPVEHLKDKDFFDVPNFPAAILTVTSVDYITEENRHLFIANISIKGITQSQKFYAIADANSKTLTSKFKIDRTRWGITYNHKLKDKAISDAIEFDVHLVFK